MDAPSRTSAATDAETEPRGRARTAPATLSRCSRQVCLTGRRAVGLKPAPSVREQDATIARQNPTRSAHVHGKPPATRRAA